MQTDYRITARRPDLVIIFFKNCCILNFAVSEDHRVKSKKAKKRQVVGHCERTKKAAKHESDSDTNCNWRTWNGPQNLRVIPLALGSTHVLGK